MWKKPGILTHTTNQQIILLCRTNPFLHFGSRDFQELQFGNCYRIRREDQKFGHRGKDQKLKHYQ